VPELKLVSALDPSAQGALAALDARMAGYYNRPEIAAYYAQHHAANQAWPAGSEHDVIRRGASAGMSVLDLGCGSAHSYVNLAAIGVRYTGVDVSARQMGSNREAFGRGVEGGTKPEFVAASLYETGLADGQFDLVFSTYVIEHLVWPHRFLREAVRVTRPGGRIVILCPHFRPAGRIPSFRYGRTVELLKERLRRGRLVAAARHLFLRNVWYPRVVRRDFPAERFPFLINLDPSCFYGPYYADNDAVYLTDRREIVAELARLGAVDETARVAGEMGVRVHPGSCMVVARKEGS
jgi:ubiquinone/menaquinone biosynthesis C-methylase UbiE